MRIKTAVANLLDSFEQFFGSLGDFKDWIVEQGRKGNRLARCTILSLVLMPFIFACAALGGGTDGSWTGSALSSFLALALPFIIILYPLITAPMLIAAAIAFANFLTPRGKKTEKTEGKEGVGTVVVRIVSSILLVEVLFGLYFWVVPVRRDPVLVAVLLATVMGIGLSYASMRGKLVRYAQAVLWLFFVGLTATFFLGGRSVAGENAGKFWKDVKNFAVSTVETPRKDTGSAITTLASKERFAKSEHTLIHLEPGVWSNWYPLGWNTDWTVDWSTPDEFLETEYNDGSRCRMKHGVPDDINRTGGTHLGPGNSELKVRVMSCTGGCAWVTKSWRGFFR